MISWGNMKYMIALLQLLAGDSLEEQLEIGKFACRQTKKIGTDIALFLEMWISDYVIPQEDGKTDELFVEPDSDFVLAFKRTVDGHWNYPF